MIIYVSHASGFDYQNELYLPLTRSKIQVEHRLIFPHGDGLAQKNSKQTITGSDIILGEVSYPSTGQGVELGWAESMGKVIICFACKDSEISSSIRFVCREYFEYETTQEMVEKLVSVIEIYAR